MSLEHVSLKEKENYLKGVMLHQYYQANDEENDQIICSSNSISKFGEII